MMEAEAEEEATGESVGSGMAGVDLVKHHGLGNDFLISLNQTPEVGSPEAKRWCDRRTGIGADGLIVAERTGSDQQSWSMVLWNADGSRAEISGNGLRCLGQAIGRLLSIESESVLTISTDAGDRELTLFPSNQQTWNVRAGMGSAAPGPLSSSAWIDAGVHPVSQHGVDIGNPHIVAVVDDIDSFNAADMGVVGPVIEAGYPGGINVHIVYVDGVNNIRLKVWERGVGVTRACGSGACAAAWVAHDRGLVGPEITVAMPGGSATVELASDEIFLIGPATFIGRIRIV